jgi:hypothetical protein
MSWEDVDAGWGRHAAAFAYLIENLHWREYQHLLDQTGVASGTRYLDIACGSGLAVRLACERGVPPRPFPSSSALLRRVSSPSTSSAAPLQPWLRGARRV